MITHKIIDSGGELYATGESMEDAIRNLDEYYIASDFGCDDWDEVVAEWMESDDGLGDFVCVPIEVEEDECLSTE